MIGRGNSPSALEIEKQKGFDDFELKLGDVMRGERATLSKSLLDVQRELRIKAAYIAAIESGDLSAFDTLSFLPGYVRSYARYLNIDTDWAMERFAIETGFKAAGHPASTRTAKAPPKRPEPFSSTNVTFVPKPDSFWSKIELRAIGSVVLLAVLVTGIGYGGWSVLKDVQRINLTPVDQAPNIIADIDPILTPDSVQVADAVPDAPTLDTAGRIYRPQSLDAPSIVSRDGPIASLDPNQVGLLPRSLIGPPIAATAAMNPSAVATASVAQAAQATPAGLEVLAVRPSWVRVTSADGNVLLEKVMDAGERYVVPQMASAPTLRAGESGAVYFAINGVAHGPVGKRGQVTKNITLSNEAINEKYTVANVSADGDLAKMVAVADASGATGAN